MLFLRSSIFAVFSWVGMLYYVMLIVFASISIIAIIVRKKRYKVDFFLLCFLLVGLLSILLNDINPFFQPYQRYFGFVMVALSFGSLLMTNNNVEIKLCIFYYFKLIGVVFTLVSLVMSITNISTPISSISAFGLAIHDMTMAPLAFITALLVLDDIINKNNKKKVVKISRIVVFILCVICGAMCGSRGAIGAFLVATIVFIMLNGKGRKRVLYLGVFSIFAILIYITNPMGVLDHFFEKMDRDKDDTSYVLSGRDEMVQDRIDDFKSSPVYGVGFAAMKNIGRSKVSFEKGTMESGSSLFLILGSTGFLGMLFYVLTLISNMVKPIKKRKNCSIIACVCFFLIHSLVEGYIISFGAPLCAIFWLLLGILRSRVEYKKIII